MSAADRRIRGRARATKCEHELVESRSLKTTRHSAVEAEGREIAGCDLCDGQALLDVDGVVAVAPARPANDLDLWVGPSEHVTLLSEVEASTRSAWLEALRSVIGRWRTNCGADGANVFAYVGSPRRDWPGHVALRIIGRRRAESANPVHLFNGGGTASCTAEIQRAALADVGTVAEPQRWLLTTTDQLRTCMSCAPDRLEEYLIGDVGDARLFQHGGAVDVGMLITCPIRHVERVEDLGGREFDSLLTTVDVVRSMFLIALEADGLWLGFNDGPVAGQETPHVHVHLWAREATDKTNPFADGLPPMVGRPSAQQVQALRDAARRAFAIVRDQAC